VYNETVRVSYLELTSAPALDRNDACLGRVSAERLSVDEYLRLYRLVGAACRWDQRLRMPRGELAALLDSACRCIYVSRNADDDAVGFCEFERHPPQIELKNFGLIPEVQGKGLGSALLSAALYGEWQHRPRRIWLHTDTWDHPAAMNLYLRAGFRPFLVRDEPPGDL